MRVHETPSDLAEALASYAPKRISALLDPAAGAGSLLIPLLQRTPISRVVAVDRRSCCKAQLNRVLPGADIEFVHGDFLSVWSGLGKFDCIVMNPPFDARRRRWVSCSRAPSGIETEMPVEAAFLSRSIELLRSGGTLLAVLPASIISSQSLVWLRNYLLSAGSVHVVHELPACTFKNTEVTVYMMVFEKRLCTVSIAVCNSSLSKPKTIRIRRDQVGHDARLDYGYLLSTHLMGRLKKEEKRLGWQQLQRLALVRRGSVSSPITNDKIVHTTAAEGPIWRTVPDPSSRRTRVHTQPGDILLQRVGRFSSRCIGVPETYGNKVSDCVLIVRPSKQSSSKALFFALRVLLGCGSGVRLLQRGTGARFICSSDLQKLEIPATLHLAFPAEFSRFSKGVDAGDVHLIEAAENEVRKRLRWNEGN